MADNDSSTVINTLPPLLDQFRPPIVSDHDMRWIEGVLISAILAISVMGVVTNVINIRVFAHQGATSDSNTICLFSLAVADLLGCFFLVPYAFVSAILSYVLAPEVFAGFRALRPLYSGIPHLAMSRVTCWITVFLAVERCLCVLLPFKVKTLVGRRFTAIVMALFFMVATGNFIPFLLGVRVVMPVNSTAVQMYNMGTSVILLNVIFNVVLPKVSAAIVTISTGIMLHKLHRYKTWREKSASTSSADASKGGEGGGQQSDMAQRKRDVEVLKTVTVITGVFLVCLSANLIPGLASTNIPGFHHGGSNTNVYFLFYHYKYLFDVINSSTNYFFYIRISSRYKTAFGEVFGGQPKKGAISCR